MSKILFQKLVLLSLLSLITVFEAYGFGFFGERPSHHREHVNPRSRFTPEVQQIALLLPLTGQHADSAKAIREGFFAAYYANHQNRKPHVRVYDSTRENIERIYELAIQHGADFVVGPLSKEDVLRIGRMGSFLQVPVLALNNHPELFKTPSNFVTYTLAPETEAEQIAEKAWQKGYRSASIVVPENAWGQRTASAFSARWQAFGGKVVRTVFANPNQDQAAAVRKLLGIDQSQKRANDIKNLISEKVEFQPRRRQDVDVIVMAAPPAQARQLKPLFDFYYAEDVPVLATSSIYSGHPNPKNDRDVNGVVFCDMPWLLDEKQGSLLRQLLENGEEHSDQYNRLFAMGFDAYNLTGNLRVLQGQGQYSGVTGSLQLGNNNQIERKLTWAKMVDGIPNPIN